MKHYPHHIGDFDRATRHLTRIERSVYRDLLDMYYDSEQRLPLDVPMICRKIIARSNEEITAVQQVLDEFFNETESGYWHERCEAEIEAYRGNCSQRAQAGKASAAKKAAAKERALNSRSTDVQQPLSPVATESNGESTNQEPRTKNQDIEPSVLVGAKAPPPPDTRLDCPYQRIADVWNEVAQSLPAVRQAGEWAAGRKAATRARWAEKLKLGKYDSVETGVAYWRKLFAFVEASDFLAGRSGKWRADFDWVMNPSNLGKIVEGKYVNEREAVPA